MNEVEVGDFVRILSIHKGKTYHHPYNGSYLQQKDVIYIIDTLKYSNNKLIGICYLCMNSDGDICNRHIYFNTHDGNKFEIIENYISPGDEIRVIKINDPFNLIKDGDLITVEKVRNFAGSSQYSDKHKVIETDFGESIWLFDSIVEKVSENTKDKKHSCICDMTVLLQKGCQCGGI